MNDTLNGVFYMLPREIDQAFERTLRHRFFHAYVGSVAVQLYYRYSTINA